MSVNPVRLAALLTCQPGRAETAESLLESSSEQTNIKSVVHSSGEGVAFTHEDRIQVERLLLLTVHRVQEQVADASNARNDARVLGGRHGAAEKEGIARYISICLRKLGSY